ncbi:MAG: hypothetical protein P8Y71_15810 [Pseudolabrys sp.]|jgi:hypothetical protein
MAWGNKFPVFRQLNAILPVGNQAARANSREFFVRTYGPDGAGYSLGRLCLDWEPNQKEGPPPPWQNEDEDVNVDVNYPWVRSEAQGWFDHCRDELNAQNRGTDQFGRPGTVHDDLQRWVREAMLDVLGTPPGQGHEPSNVAQAIRYRYRRTPGAGAEWKADRKWNGQHWEITVYGPGF